MKRATWRLIKLYSYVQLSHSIPGWALCSLTLVLFHSRAVWLCTCWVEQGKSPSGCTQMWCPKSLSHHLPTQGLVNAMDFS